MDHIRACVENLAPASEPAEQEEFPSFARNSTTDPVDPFPVSETPEAIGIAGSGTAYRCYPSRIHHLPNRFNLTLLD